MNKKDDEVFRLEAHRTHLNRYLIAAEKIGEFAEEMEEKGFVETVDRLRYGELLQNAFEALAIIHDDISEELDRYRVMSNNFTLVLRHYAEEYGKHFVAKTLADKPFALTTTVKELGDNMIDIEIKVQEWENDH
jgi:hypothetical protein